MLRMKIIEFHEAEPKESQKKKVQLVKIVSYSDTKISSVGSMDDFLLPQECVCKISKEVKDLNTQSMSCNRILIPISRIGQLYQDHLDKLVQGLLVYMTTIVNSSFFSLVSMYFLSWKKCKFYIPSKYQLIHKNSALLTKCNFLNNSSLAWYRKP